MEKTFSNQFLQSEHGEKMCTGKEVLRQHSYMIANFYFFVLLTLLGSWGAWRNLLVGVDRGFRSQAVELFAADQVDLLEVLHLLL